MLLKRSCLALAAFIAAVGPPNVAEAAVEITKVVYHSDSCPGGEANTISFTTLDTTGPVKASCMIDGNAYTDPADNCPVSASSLSAAPIDCEALDLSLCTHGIKIEDATSEAILCWNVAAGTFTTHSDCAGADVTIMQSALTIDHSWSGTGTSWADCSAGSSDSLSLTSIDYQHVDCGDAANKTVVIVKHPDGTGGNEVTCWDGTDAVGTAVSCSGDGATTCDLTFDLGLCTAGLKVESADSTPLEYHNCWGSSCAGADVTMDSVPAKGQRWDGSGTSWTGSDCSAGGGDMVVEFDTVVRISSSGCKATDIGRDYTPPDGETTTTIGPDDAIESDSLYIGGDNNIRARSMFLICEKAAVGDAEPEEVQRVVSIAIPAFVNLGLKDNEDDPIIDLADCVKLSIKYAGDVLDQICFRASGQAEHCRTYLSVPSTTDSSLDASKEKFEQGGPQWTNVVGVGCNDRPTVTTGAPGGNGVMATVSGVVAMSVCAMFALMI